MSNEEFRRELNSVFDDVSGSPSSNLPNRVSSAIANPPEVRGPNWLAAVAAAVMAVLIIGVLYVAGPLKPPLTVGGVHPTPSPSPSAQPTSQPSPIPTPSVAYVCTASTVNSVGNPPAVVYVSGLRTGTHTGYDRLTIDLANGEPATVEVKVQTGTSFTMSPSGLATTVRGKNAILLTIRGADLHTSYNGSTDIVTGYPGLAEVKRIQDFEGVVQLAVGLNGATCYRAYFLNSPDRLVIDIQTAS